jgi:hypothetical protein
MKRDKRNVRRKPARKVRATGRARKAAPQRHFTFMLPVYFQFQFTFRERDVESPDDDEPEIKSTAIRALEKELEEYIFNDYAISKLEIVDDGLDAVFLGRDRTAPCMDDGIYGTCRIASSVSAVSGPRAI